MTIQTEPFARRVSEFNAAQIPGNPLQGFPLVAERSQAEDSGLEVFVAHQDLATGVRAKQTLDRLCRQLRLAHCLHLHLWRFELLEDSILWREAVRNASRADILFFSLHGDRPLPSGLCHWFKHWLLLRDERPCALVVSLDENERDSESGRNALDYLRSVAATGGIEVFPYFEATTADDSLTGNTRPKWRELPGLIPAQRSAVPAISEEISPPTELFPGRNSCLADEDPMPLVAAAAPGASSRGWGLND